MGLSLLDLITYILPVILSLREVGRLFFRGPYMVQLFIGLCITAGVISPLYYWQVHYVRNVLFAIFLFGALLFFKRFPWKILNEPSLWRFNVKKKNLGTLLAIYIFTFIFFSLLYSQFYVFENHDVLYFGWMQEAWNPDYSGSIRVPTQFPALMASNHLLPGALLSTLGLLLPEMNLVKAIDLRYLTICLVLAQLLIELQRRNSRHFFKCVICGITLFIVYGSEISTELNMSSFVYVLLLGCIMLVLFEADSAEKRQRLFLLFTLLLIAKAPIFLISAFVLLILGITDLKTAFRLRNVSVLGIALINVFTWGITPKPVGLGTGFPLPVGFKFTHGIRFDWTLINYDQVLGWYTGHEAWFISRYIHKPYIFGIVIFLILTKIYFVYFFLRKKVRLSPLSILALDAYMAASMFSGLLLRNNGSLAHQAHAYLLAATITFVLGVSYLSNRLKWRHLIGFFILSVLVQIPTRYLPFFGNDMDVRLSGKTTMTLLQAESGKISTSDLIGKKEVYYSMLGYRIPLSATEDYASSQVHLFIQGR